MLRLVRRLAPLVLIACLGCGGALFNQISQTGYFLIGTSTIRPFNVSDGSLLGVNITLAQPMRDICYRSDGQLYGVGADQKLYRINTFNGACTAAASTGLGFVANSFGMAIYPGTSQLRLVVSSGENYRYNAQIGTLINQDPNLAFAGGDVNSGVPTVAALAYQDSSTPVLFGIDGARDVLVKITNENNGTTSTVGPLGFNAAGDVSLSIDQSTNTGIAVWDGGGSPGIYRINLTTGAATLISSAPTGVDGVAAPFAN